MGDPYTLFAKDLVTTLLEEAPQLAPDPDNPCRVRAPRPDGNFASLNLTPFQGPPQLVSALPYFQHVLTMDDLLTAYHQASKAMPLEGDLPGMTISPPARSLLADLLEQAQATLADTHAQRIARFVQNFDIYVAVKAVESLLNSRADLALLGIAEEQGWTVHFDHVAIRCGSGATQDAERVAQLLQTIHGYLPSQVPEEAAYQFPDGWDAYPLYKMLTNGQVLRIFLDQSDAEAPAQIIQHWNRVYGFTAHHLALRASRQGSDERQAVSLETLIQALKKAGIDSREATGHYTAGLLLQVFVQPERHVKVASKIKQELAAIDPSLERSIENGKLLELVSRREMPALLAKEYFALYGLTYEQNNPLHSAPYYHYFLPAQAAHVIRTSVA
ncbi:hypothetical protein [Nitrosococcus wardiae]|uniref:Uncharacterized protein n=1 Tax=Nitrosococcus wardiae TaxID=1814290 RepID=A0A4P7C2B7_9GAMM|nr:hypothetical protein [Nitrosococcus wardiae]QBQ55869.1 hypothetical protein E3U44_16115 [Nitrosococcus wardiae]